MNCLRVTLFGEFALEREGEPVRLATRQARSLLAFLLCYPEPHTREELATMFWGDVTDQSARHSLNVALSAIRSVLGREFLVTDRTHVQRNPDAAVWCDVSEFETIGNAQLKDVQSKIELYRAPLLEEFYDEWVLRARERYQQLAIAALLRLVEHFRASGDYETAIGYSERVLALDPASERAHQHLIFLMAVSGNRLAALSQYERLVRILHDELDAEPSPETTALLDWLHQTPPGASVDAARLTNLPIPLTSFIGRTEELQEIQAAMEAARLVTLTGAGGSGKTRLAIQTGMNVLASARDGVWWVELAALVDETRVAQAIGQVLGVQDSLNRPVVQEVISLLRDKELVLILDNCEHLIQVCAELAHTLLQSCPRLKILATSREPLGVLGESLYQVPTLPYPNPHQSLRTENLFDFAATRLFIERTRAVKSGFAASDENANRIAYICARLDGIPLAIELAAARMSALSVTEVAARLDDRFNLLTRGDRTSLPRQQTLRALIEWSHDLLTPAEAVLFRRLSVFSGGFELAAAQAVTTVTDAEETPQTFLDTLTRLVEKSLVLASVQGEVTRYSLLETILEFACEKLRAAGEIELLSARHFEYFYQKAEEMSNASRDAMDWNLLDYWEREHANLSAALDWAHRQSLQHPTGLDRGIDLMDLTWYFWFHRGHMEENALWLDKFLKLPEVATPSRVHGLVIATYRPRSRGDWLPVIDITQRALKIAEEIGNPVLISLAKQQLAQSYRDVCRFDEAIALYSESLEDADDGQHGFEYYRHLFMLAECHVMKGELDTAEPMWRQGVEWFSAHPDQASLAWALEGLGNLARLRNDFEQADALYQQSLGLKFAGMDKVGLIYSFDALAQLSASREQWVRATQLWGAAEKLKEQMGLVQPPSQVMIYESLIPNARATLGAVRFEHEWATGYAMTLQQAVSLGQAG